MDCQRYGPLIARRLAHSLRKRRVASIEALLTSSPHVVHVSPSVGQIWIKTLTGRKQQFNFEGDDLVLSVKQALQEKEGIQVCLCHPVCSERPVS